jgi:hypothetical protein
VGEGASLIGLRPFLLLPLFTNIVEDEFCELRLLGILGSPDEGSCIAPPRTAEGERLGVEYRGLRD